MTASALYEGFDWATASPLEMRIEAEYLRARHDAYPQERVHDELTRLLRAAEQRGMRI